MHGVSLPEGMYDQRRKLQKRGYEPGGSKDIYDIHQEKSLESKWVGDGFFPPTALTLGSQPR